MIKLRESVTKKATRWIINFNSSWANLALTIYIGPLFRLDHSIELGYARTSQSSD